MGVTMGKKSKEKTSTKSKRGRISREQIIAYHEAGHAVMRHILGHGFKSISTTKGEDGSEGRVRNKPGLRLKSWTKEAAIQNEEEIMALMSGMAATCILRGRPRIQAAEIILQGNQDWDRASVLAKQRCISTGVIGDRETDHYLRWLEIRTQNTLKRRWGAVVALADAVMGGKKLSEEQAVRIIEGNEGRISVVHENGVWEIRKVGRL